MRLRRLGHLTLLALTLGMLIIGAGRLSAAERTGPVPGRFVVKLAPRVSPASLAQALSTDQSFDKPAALVGRADRNGSEGWDRVWFLHTTDHSLTADQIIEQLGADKVEQVEPDYYVEFFDYPTDTYFAHQWYLNNTGQEYWAVDRLDGDGNDTLALFSGAPGSDIGIASTYTSPPVINRTVVVAIVDTGVDPLHPDLQGAFWRNLDEIPGNGLDDDHNGYIDDTLGYDISGDVFSLYDFEGDNDPTDTVGHGTHIAGIIAARHNGLGVAGIASTAEIMPIKIRPNATSAVGALGIIYAVNSGADIINISWGTPFESWILEDALEYATANGVLVCVASGNSGNTVRYYPAASDYAFTIAAGNSAGNMTEFSTYGAHVDLVAPGQNILSLRATGTDMYTEADEPLVHIVGDDQRYYLADGTSMAAPMVAGAAALIWAVRPQLTLDQIKTDLRYGARDIIDPFGRGDTLIGVDTISGFGFLDIENTLDLARTGGLFIVDPIERSRHVGSMTITAAPVGGYTGGWTLAYEETRDPGNWVWLAEGLSLPTDSILHVFSDPVLNGQIRLRLTDDFGVSRFATAVFVSGREVLITSPVEGAVYEYEVPVIGSVFGPDYRGIELYLSRDEVPPYLIYETGGEFFDSLIFSWNASEFGPGVYTLYVEGDFQDDPLADTITFTVASAFAPGWPQELSGRGSLSAVAADIDGNGTKEIIVGTTYGLNVFESDGTPREGFPALIETSTRCIPAAYDVDRDGLNEIICTTDSGLHVFNHDGSYAAGWPQLHDLGRLTYGSPNPIVAELDANEDSAILVLDNHGNMMAYEFNGDSYFYSLEGWFGSFNQEPHSSLNFAGNALSGADLNGDGYNELVVSFVAERPYSGIGIFEARTGQPAFDRPLPYVLEVAGLYGMVLADLDDDGNPEIIASGYDSTGTMTVWVKTDGTDDPPGWPRLLPEVEDWLGGYPMAADLDMDGTPEILVTFYEFDIASLYVFRADGSPYVTIEGRPPGEAFFYQATFGSPIVANLVGDDHPEVIIRSGYIFPGTGREQIHVLDYTMTPVPGWPIATPTSPYKTFSTPYAPLVDDIDADGMVEMILVSEGLTVFVWDFETSSNEGLNVGRLFMDNCNSSVLPPERVITDVPPTLEAGLPREFRLHQNYPNPFNPTTALRFELPTRQEVRLDVYNVLGQRVATPVNQELPAGSHTVEFNATGLASGVYLYRLASGSDETTRKMVLLK